jgi:glycoprotein 6-alpha-L-fucosyltransferase
MKDKLINEASFHSLDEYMVHVDDFYAVQEIISGERVRQRRVFLASDDPSVLAEARAKYKSYEFIFDETSSKTSQLNSRYSPASAQGVIQDIFFLSECDYLVCTLSSSVCRVAYVLMQTRHPDASWRVQSLDDIYYFAEQNAHNMQAIFDHDPCEDLGEIELKKGDIIGIAGNHWNGYSKGINQRTKKSGLFPSYKVINIVDYF